MDATYQHVVHGDAASFAFTRYDLDHFPFFWHFHPEYELTLIRSGHGHRHVGDHIGSYAAGDLVLIGPDLPHSWISLPSASASERSVAIVLRFRRDFLGDAFLERPEMAGVRALLDDATHGLAFPAEAASQTRRLLAHMDGRDELGRLIDLLAVLGDLAAAPKPAKLASDGYRPALHKAARRRMADICAYVGAHHDRRLRLEEVAAVVHMTPSAFSRAFRRATGRTFTAYVNEVRVGVACRMLVETELPVASIAAECGFRNLANFNRRFRELRRTTPRAYRRAFAN